MAVEVEDPREDHSVLFEVEQPAHAPALHLAVDEMEPGLPPAVELDDLALA